MAEIEYHPLIWDEIAVCAHHGTQCPLITEAAIAAERARLADAVRRLEHPCHEVCYGDLHADCQCAAYIRQSVLDMLAEREEKP